MVKAFNELTTITAETDGHLTLYISYSGEPVTQERPRARVIWKSHKIIMWDPCASFKNKLKGSIKKSLHDIGLTNLPLFSTSKVQIELEFGVKTDNKDLDNLEKLIMDVLTKIVYSDDVKVVKKNSAKINAPGGGYTSVAINLL
mmetsp:Transcript_21502/g.32523  ORF Transcript_21502/g.32523 Transcript_21502/m.32523 type:complete len:144 (+) Transcript_21502:239-670(+)